MALHSTEEAWARSVWDQWSMQSSKYEEGKQEKSWRSFTADGKRTIGTLFFMAKEHGWHPPRHAQETPDRGLFRIWHRPPRRTPAPQWR